MVTIVRKKRADWRIEVKKLEGSKIVGTKLISLKEHENLTLDEMRDQIETAITVQFENKHMLETAKKFGHQLEHYKN